MQWTTSYLVGRPSISTYGEIFVVHRAEQIKQTRYWLQYIATPGDAIFITPLHRNYKGSGDPTYSTHLVCRGKLEHDEKLWIQQVFNGIAPTQFTFVDSPPNAEQKAISESPSQTTIAEVNLDLLLDGKPHKLSLSELAALTVVHGKNISVVLAQPSKWIDWESALTLMTREVHITKIEPNASWPLVVALRPGGERHESIEYDPSMQFIVKPAEHFRAKR